MSELIVTGTKYSSRRSRSSREEIERIEREKAETARREKEGRQKASSSHSEGEVAREVAGDGEPLCRLCGGPVRLERERYDVFERMHWLCFHVIYEHFGDRDEPCEDPICPQWHLQVYERELRRLGRDPAEVIEEAMDERYGL